MLNRFLNDRSRQTVELLKPVAAELAVSLTALSVAWSRQHDFVASTIIGATSVEQLEASLAARDLILDTETMKRIDQIDELIPNPMREDGLRRI
ncbi:MAG: aldo/keto reductase [Fuerstiella sp.]|nr:aldo/keto reductase [Fuerstiella sp.]